MKAEDARKLTAEHSLIPEIIYTLIRESSIKGYYTVTVSHQIVDEWLEKLKAEGYGIAFTGWNTDGYAEHVIISWS